jgi:predicted small secreted protein
MKKTTFIYGVIFGVFIGIIIAYIYNDRKIERDNNSNVLNQVKRLYSMELVSSAVTDMRAFTLSNNNDGKMARVVLYEDLKKNISLLMVVDKAIIDSSGEKTLSEGVSFLDKNKNIVQAVLHQD